MVLGLLYDPWPCPHPKYHVLTYVLSSYIKNYSECKILLSRYNLPISTSSLIISFPLYLTPQTLQSILSTLLLYTLFLISHLNLYVYRPSSSKICLISRSRFWLLLHTNRSNSLSLIPISTQLSFPISYSHYHPPPV